LESNKPKRQLGRPTKLLELEPFDWWKGTERTSEEIDQLLYGEEF